MLKNKPEDVPLSKKKEEKDLRKINKITDVEWMFRNEAKRNSGEYKDTFIRKLFKRDFWKFVSTTLIYLLQASPVWLLPLITTDVIDLITVRQNGYVQRLVIDGVLLSVVILQNIFSTAWRSSIVNKMIRRTTAEVKSGVTRKLQRLSITYHKEIEEGRIQSKLLRDIESVEVYYRMVLQSLVPCIVGAFVSIIIALFKSPVVTLFFLAIIPLNVLVSWAFRKHIRKESYEYRKENESLSMKLTTTLQMITLSKAHGLIPMEQNEVAQKISDVTRAGLKLDKTNAYFGAMMWVISQLLSAGCLFFCAFLAIKNIITPGEVVLFQSLFISISGSILGVINIYPNLISGKEAIRSVSEIMNAGEMEKDGGRIPIDKIDGKVNFCHMSYHYPNETQNVVNDFNLDVSPGERIAIVGSSGSGKSTVMNLIIGLLSPTEGEIYIDDKSMEDISMTDYRKFISVVPQNSILFSGTIRENITYGLENYTEEELNKVLEDANVMEFLPSLPHGIDTQVGEHGDKLSGGQKQRICIARALIRKPKILIMDEATSALDNVSEYHVQKAIDRLVQERTTFIVAHRLSTIRNADRIVVMENGEIVELGTYDELTKKGGRFSELERLNRIKEEEIKN